MVISRCGRNDGTVPGNGISLATSTLQGMPAWSVNPVAGDETWRDSGAAGDDMDVACLARRVVRIPPEDRGEYRDRHQLIRPAVARMPGAARDLLGHIVPVFALSQAMGGEFRSGSGAVQRSCFWARPRFSQVLIVRRAWSPSSR